MTAYSSETEIIQNLKDAGCWKDTILKYVEDIRQGEMESGKHLLEIHRRSLLDDLHRVQKHIDCLDYLVYQMDKAKLAGTIFGGGVSGMGAIK